MFNVDLNVNDLIITIVNVKKKFDLTLLHLITEDIPK